MPRVALRLWSRAVVSTDSGIKMLAFEVISDTDHWQMVYRGLWAEILGGPLDRQCQL